MKMITSSIVKDIIVSVRSQFIGANTIFVSDVDKLISYDSLTLVRYRSYSIVLYDTRKFLIKRPDASIDIEEEGKFIVAYRDGFPMHLGVALGGSRSGRDLVDVLLNNCSVKKYKYLVTYNGVVLDIHADRKTDAMKQLSLELGIRLASTRDGFSYLFNGRIVRLVVTRVECKRLNSYGDSK